MTNGIYFYNTIREEWSASTSLNETPRPSFVHDGGDPTTEASPSSSSSGAIGDGDGGKLEFSNLKFSNFKELEAATRKFRHGGIRFNIFGGGKSGFSNLKNFSFKELEAATRKFRHGGVRFNIFGGGKSGFSNLKNFSFKELESATRKFKVDGVLGEGRFGIVYKGWIDKNTLTATKPGKGIAVAVKRLNQQGFEGRREWLAEVYVGQLYHPNLVRLLGYCFDNEEYLLVYESMPRGSLDNHLFRRGSSCPLSWRLRMKVALGAAKGLAFLHTAQINVMHRGVHCSNILLDSDYNSKLSDFGLAKDGPTGNMSHVSTRVKGIYGYTAPEYVATGHLNSKNDVYGFGVVLLEILSGRRTIDWSGLCKEQNLVEWGRPYLKHKDKISYVLDKNINGQYTLEDGLKVATLAYHCLSSDLKRRPNMDEVTQTLEELQNSEYT